ncbi:MAG TPA: hypothetical protein VFZ91_14045 [Allosphingosinicella sp.]
MKLKRQDEEDERRALLELLALGNRDIEAGRTRPLRDVLARLRAKNAAM